MCISSSANADKIQCELVYNSFRANLSMPRRLPGYHKKLIWHGMRWGKFEAAKIGWEYVENHNIN